QEQQREQDAAHGGIPWASPGGGRASLALRPPGAGQLLFLGPEAALDLADILPGRQGFWPDVAIGQDPADVGVVADVLRGDGGFVAQVALLDLRVRHFVREVLRLDGNRGQEVGEWATVRHAEAILHVLRVRSAEEGLVALADDPAEARRIDAAFEQHAGERLLRQRQL